MTLAAKITADGISSPTYEDILVALQNAVFGIYGSDVYLGNDSQDGQLLAVVAQAIYDNNQLAIAVYNSYSPVSAQGVGLSQQVKINGIRRLISSNSQVDVDIVGANGTPIINGIVGDDQSLGTQWALPALVTIPGGGTITVTATCTEPGAIAASANSITKILTPTAGWQTVNNASAATPGAPVETDSKLRQRQAVSTALPALSVKDAILGALLNLIGVGRAYVYENDTGAPDANGIPAHSLSAVIQGGDAQTIANTIALYKTPGTGTYGTTGETVVDPAGISSMINFYQLTIVQIFALVLVTPLTGYVSTTATAIEQALAQWFNTLAIGEDSYLGRLYSPANLSGDAAMAGTGFSQAQLDALSNTYNLTSVWQARSDMAIIGGPYVAGVNVVNVTNTGSLAIGQSIKQVLDDGTYLSTSITNKAGTAITMLNNIPGGRSVQNGALMYVAGDLVIAFNEASGSVNANTKVVTP